MCQKWDVPFVAGSLDVQTYKEQAGVGTQVAARELRYRFFAEQMTRFQADYLALGHHGDDQVETMLMSFTRSSSTARSEEHTSELQSRFDLVCRLLPAKKT